MYGTKSASEKAKNDSDEENVMSPRPSAPGTGRNITGSWRALIGLAFAGFSSFPLAAAFGQETIELNAFDGSAVVRGELIEVSHGSYVIRTALGTLRIGIEDAECVGETCPRLDRFDKDFTIVGSSVETASALEALVSGYADQLEADVQIEDIGETASEVTILDGTSNRPLATIGLTFGDANTPPRGDGIQLAAIDGADSVENRLSVFHEENVLTGATDVDARLLAIDGVAVIVHPDSPVDVLTRRDIADLFTCAEPDRQEGRASPIYVRSRNSESFAAFKATVLDPFGVELCDRAIALPSDDGVADAVAVDRNAVGFVSLSHVHDARTVPVEECGLVHEPSLFSAKAEDYPLARRLLLSAPALAESSGAEQRFIDFALSDAGQQALEKKGLIGLNLETTGSYPSRYRLARVEAAASSLQDTTVVGRLLDHIQDAIRLSATFRFTSGGGNVDEAYGLDSRAQRDLIRVVDFLRTSAPTGTEVLVLGFADASGPYDANLALSRQRAQSVADKLAALGVPLSAVEGFGEEAPVACNDNSSGRAQNRRVEVWLRVPEDVQSRDGQRITM